MKTVFINCSPKKRFCASAYFLFLQRLFTGGRNVYHEQQVSFRFFKFLECLGKGKHQAETICLRFSDDLDAR